jgi:hypothetical protein
LIIPLGLAIAVIAGSHSSTSVNIPNIGPAGPTGGGVTTSTPGVSISHPGSYLNAKGLAAGLARVRHLAPGSKVLLLRIDSTSLSATVVRGHGKAEEILLEPSSTLKEPAGSPGSGGVPLSQINPAVPARLISQLGKQFHVPRSHISYLVAVAFQGLAPTWGIYLKNDADYHASLSGAGLHKG